MSRYQDLTGQKFGRLTVLEYAGRDNGRFSLWRCRCVCGKYTTARASSLRYGTTKSCGCLQAERTKEAATTHGLSGGRKQTPRLYRIWRNMKSRCFNPKTPKFQNHGGRGITVCTDWLQYASFHDWAMQNDYDDWLTLERIDNNGDYEPGNCKWVTPKQQNLNTRRNRLFTYMGETMTLKEWSTRLGMQYSTLKARLLDYGWPISKAFTTPVKRRNKHEALNP